MYPRLLLNESMRLKDCSIFVFFDVNSIFDAFWLNPVGKAGGELKCANLREQLRCNYKRSICDKSNNSHYIVLR